MMSRRDYTYISELIWRRNEMLYYQQSTKFNYCEKALQTEGLTCKPADFREQGQVIYAYFDGDAFEAVRLAHNRVQRRGNTLFEVYGYGQDHLSGKAYLRFALKAWQS